MPLGRQPRLLRNIARWLRPGGWLLAVTGQDAWTGTQDNWLGGTAPMWWSQADAATYRTWLAQAGLEVTSQQFVPEGDSGHALFWARLKPADSPASRKGPAQPVMTISVVLADACILFSRTLALTSPARW